MSFALVAGGVGYLLAGKLLIHQRWHMISSIISKIAFECAKPEIRLYKY